MTHRVGAANTKGKKMNSYYIRLTWNNDETSHHDVTADTIESAIALAKDKAALQGHGGNAVATVYQNVGSHNILLQREPLIVA
jgi:hypothetical protein